MKYTVSEFAKEIRNLYPSDYDDLSNDKLVELWLKKYPNDIDKIDFGKENTKDSNGFGNILLGIIAVVGLFFIIGKFKSSNSNTQNQSSNYSSNKSKSIDNNSTQSSPIKNSDNNSPVNNKQYGTCLGVQMTKQKADSLYQMFTSIENTWTSDEIDGLKLLLYNPDPENLSGKSCGTYYSNCKWCTNSIEYEKKYTKLDFGVLIISIELISEVYGELSKQSQKEKTIEEIKKYLKESKVNKGVSCDGEPPKFCSEKCKCEYKAAHNGREY